MCRKKRRKIKTKIDINFLITYIKKLVDFYKLGYEIYNIFHFLLASPKNCSIMNVLE